MSEVSSSQSPDPELLDLLRLKFVPGIGPRSLNDLLAYFDSPSEILSASIGSLEQVSGIGPKLSRQIHAARDSDDAFEEWKTARDEGIDILRIGSDSYSTNLSNVDDAPHLLYCNGELQERDDLAVGIVGSRRCTVYGQQQAEKFGKTLALAGLTVVSGLARGIDAAAHRGALSVGGRTIAVLATGLLNIYPSEHADLAEQISGNGAVVSENRLHQSPLAGLFPQRNRIISGLSLGVIIVEANRRSGALHTARHAMEQGREVMAVPGRIDSLASEGCHDLLRDGVTLIRDADDVLEALGPLVKPVAASPQNEVRSTRELLLNDQERAVLNLVHSDPRAVDEVLRESDLDTSRVLATLTVLEMKRLVRRLPGGRIMRSDF